MVTVQNLTFLNRYRMRAMNSFAAQKARIPCARCFSVRLWQQVLRAVLNSYIYSYLAVFNLLVDIYKGSSSIKTRSFNGISLMPLPDIIQDTFITPVCSVSQSHVLISS